MKTLITILLTPIYLIFMALYHAFKCIEPFAQDIGYVITVPFIRLYDSMYEFWKKVFKWKQ